VRVPYHIGRDRNETAFFEYFEGWDRSSPTSVPASGGTVIQINGYGFKVGGNYSCGFSRRADSADMLVTGTATSQTVLLCQTPNWGASFVGQMFCMPCDVDDPGILSVPPMVSVSIYRGNTLVQFTDGGLAPVPPLADNICAGDACRFEFFTNWLSASVNGSVMEGNAGGTGADGMQVSIVGAGFSLNQSYHCKFETDNASVTTLATVVAVDRMLCNVSEWPVKAETARFDIWQGNMSSATSRASDVLMSCSLGPTIHILSIIPCGSKLLFLQRLQMEAPK